MLNWFKMFKFIKIVNYNIQLKTAINHINTGNLQSESVL